MASAWLQSRGWESEVWFQHVLPQSRDSVSGVAGLTRPVLVVAEPGAKKSWYYVPGQPGEPGQIPPSLRGKTLYAAGEKRLRKRSVGGSKMEKNRLSFDWNLSIAPDCTVSGELDIRVRYRWTEMLDALADGQKEQLYTLLNGLEGWIEPNAEMEVSPLGSTGFRVVVPVRARSGIEGAQGLMIGLPSVAPSPMERLRDVASSATMRFAFVVEQSYTVSIPKGYRVMSVPLRQDQGGLAGTYSSRFRVNQRKNDVEGEEKYILTQTRVDASELPSFRRVLDLWGTWRSNNLALLPTRRGK